MQSELLVLCFCRQATGGLMRALATWGASMQACSSLRSAQGLAGGGRLRGDWSAERVWGRLACCSTATGASTSVEMAAPAAAL
nr:unnamed protein product [Digitaria exilis]